MVPEAAETYWLILIYEKHILSMCVCLFIFWVNLIHSVTHEFRAYKNAPFCHQCRIANFLNMSSLKIFLPEFGNESSECT
jgi:hypothetical protein